MRAAAVLLFLIASSAEAAGTCPAMPFFPRPATAGPACTAVRQELECACSECFSWDPQPATTVSYTVERTDATGAKISRYLASSVWTDELGERHVQLPRTVYCPAKDDFPMPREGLRYSYVVRACSVSVCVPSALPIVYRAAPYVDGSRPPRRVN